MVGATLLIQIVIFIPIVALEDLVEEAVGGFLRYELVNPIQRLAEILLADLIAFDHTLLLEDRFN